MDSRDYPAGRGAVQSRYIKDVLVEFGIAKMLRIRATLAQINAGITLLPALPSVRWRLLDWKKIAIGGNATTATSINIAGTSGGSAVQLGVTAIAALTRSAIVRAGGSNAVVLADGASFVQMDVNTAITAVTVGTAMTVATAFDFFLDYVADPA